MNNLEERQQQIKTTLLSDSEINDPKSVIIDLFEATSIGYLKKDLWEGLKAAFNDSPYAYNNQPSLLLKTQNDLVRLFDALWLLLSIKQSEIGEIQFLTPQTSRDVIEFEKEFLTDLDDMLDSYQGKIQRLTREEAEFPFYAIKSFFKFHSLDEWKHCLTNWVEHAFSNNIIEIHGSNYNLLCELEFVEIALEASYLLNQDYCGLKQMPEETADNSRKELSPQIYDAFLTFLEAVPTARLNRNLRKLFFEYVDNSSDFFPPDFEYYIFDLDQLMSLLDEIQKRPHEWFKEELMDGN